ncbi:hypothetical protein NH26_21045 [Flammeovirga pacifica]|uniref:Uncharacterized protein n=1 Tax=Flammeovirga pacifica TaxID=915059 RepID=A0A1S1YSW8_FLAPC|nr:hypothetical protein NH26_21045 [Flammeovirga pacifica]
MPKYKKSSQRNLIIMSILTLFTLTIALVTEKRLKSNHNKEALIVEGVMNQNHLKWKYMH